MAFARARARYQLSSPDKRAVKGLFFDRELRLLPKEKKWEGSGRQATLCRFHQLVFACNPLMRLVAASDLIFKLAFMLWQSFGDDVLTSRDVPGSGGS
jgi:hypothetical protein